MTGNQLFLFPLPPIVEDLRDSNKWRRFLEFHEFNPEIYNIFESLALKALESRKRVSSKHIFEMMRWEVQMSTTYDGFKLCNSWSAYYSRIFMDKNIRHKNCFETRQLKAG